jgi:PAS domain S-box-containing protein
MTPAAPPDGPPLDEARRLAALHDLEVLDTPPEAVFDAVAASAARACAMPIALVCLVDAGRLWFKAAAGLEGVCEAPRAHSMCDVAVRGGELLAVPDTLEDPRFRASPQVVAGPRLRFYAGAPIVLPGGAAVGTVCVADRAPRTLDDAQRALLEGCAAIVAAALGERRRLRQAMSELATGDLRRHRMYEATPAIMHSIDADGRIVGVSDRWLEVMGYERHEVMGRRSAEFMTPESQVRAREHVLPAFFRTGRCDRVEYRLVRRDGTVLDVLLSATLERAPDGAPLRSLAVLEDVSAAKRLAAELGQTRTHLEAVVDNMPALVGYWDREGITRFANRDFQAAVGLPLERIVGRPLDEILGAVDPIGQEAIAPRSADVLAGRRQEFTCALLTTSGLRQLHVTLVPARADDGEGGGFYGTWIDVTGTKALELRQRDTEQRYRALFENLDAGYLLSAIEVDAEGRPSDVRILAMNPAFAAMNGLDPARAVGMRATEVFPGLVVDRPNWIGTLCRVAQTGERLQFERHSPISGRWFDVVAYRPAPGQFAVLTRDITRRKQLEERLVESEMQVLALQQRRQAGG